MTSEDTKLGTGKGLIVGAGLDYRAIFNVASNGMAFTEYVSGRIVDVNDAWILSTGISREKSVGRTAMELGLWARPAEREACMAKLEVKGRVSDFEAWLNMKAAELSFQISGEKVEMGGNLYVLWEFRDITVQKRMNEVLIKEQEKVQSLLAASEMSRRALLGILEDEKLAREALAESEAFRKRIFNSSRVPIVVMDAATFKYIDCNDAAVRIYGFSSREEIIGKTPLDFSVPLQYNGTPSSEKALYYIDKAAAESAVLFEWRHQRANGEIWDAEVHLMSFQSGQRRLMQFTLQDITDRKRAEDALRKSEASFRSIFEKSATGYVLLSPDGRMLKVNAAMADMLGYTVEELQQLDFRDITHPEDIAVSAESIRSLLTGQRDTYRLEKRYLHRSGATVWSFVNTTLVRDSRNTPLYFITSIADITSRIRAEEEALSHKAQLLQADKLASIGRLVAGVAHEINNPNNFIMLNTPLLRKAWECALPVIEAGLKQTGEVYVDKLSLTEFTPHVIPLLDSIQEGSRRIQRIVGDLKDYARSETYDINREIDFGKVIISAVNLIQNSIAKKSAHFSLCIGDAPVPIQGSFQRLEQVVINLLQNACDALPPKEGSISLSLNCEEVDRIVLSIADTGIGIAPKDLSHIAEPFFTTKRDIGGTGLGLSVSSKIIADHGGRLHYESEIGKGTTVKLVLPRRR
jgi:PAS domain S-box-containing protein